MKKVLIITDSFPPGFGPRMGFLAKYLNKYGWEAYAVVSGRDKDSDRFKLLCGFAKVEKFVPAKVHKPWNILHILNIFSPYDYLNCEYDIKKEALKLAGSNRFDLVLCSVTTDAFPVFAAYRVAKTLGIPFVLDLRDIREQAPRCNLRSIFSGSMSKILHNLSSLLHRCWTRIQITSYFSRDFILRRADEIVSVSEWHCKYLTKFQKNVHLIYNGFDPELFFERKCVSNTFDIVYTGSFSTGDLRDPTLLFEALSKLKNEGKLISSLCLKFYSKSSASAKRMAEKYGLLDYCSFLDYISFKDIPNVTSSASILLLLTNRSTNDGPKGIMTTKFFEYLAVNRPILCVRSDEDCLERAIVETKSGCAARNACEAYNFILSKMEEWQQNGYVCGTTDKVAIAKYSREFQAGEFAKLFDDCIEKRGKR